MRLGRVCCSLLGLLFSCLSAVDAGATPFTIEPDGNLLFNAAFTTQGTFTCLRAEQCSGSGSAVILGSGANAALLTFTGVTTSLQVGNQATHVLLGQFETAFAGAFSFPALVNPLDPNGDLLRFTFSMHQTSPIPSTSVALWRFGQDGGLRASSNFILTPTGPNPPGYNYPALAYSFTPYPFVLPSDDVLPLGANAGAIPEPTTLLLFGTTLAGLGLAGRWRQRKRQQQP